MFGALIDVLDVAITIEELHIEELCAAIEEVIELEYRESKLFGLQYQFS